MKGFFPLQVIRSIYWPSRTATDIASRITHYFRARPMRKNKLSTSPHATDHKLCIEGSYTTNRWMSWGCCPNSTALSTTASPQLNARCKTTGQALPLVQFDVSRIPRIVSDPGSTAWLSRRPICVVAWSPKLIRSASTWLAAVTYFSTWR